jgi:hypothetical protein
LRQSHRDGADADVAASGAGAAAGAVPALGSAGVAATAGREAAASGVAGPVPAGPPQRGADAIAAACGPRLGSKVERFTNSGVVAILGMPDC